MAKISVAMAVCNGEKYLRAQVDSILLQLRMSDELIISYNESTDSTYKIICEYEKKYSNVYVDNCLKKGVISNFNNAIQKCTGDIIFLADQDDVWLPNKITKVVQTMDINNVDLVIHNCDITNELLVSSGKNMFEVRKAHAGKLYNLCKNGYQGSCIAFKSWLVDVICPIPYDIAMHDQWIGLVVEKYGRVYFLDEELMLYRRHDDTSSNGRLPIAMKLRYMIKLQKYLKTLRKDSI